MKTAKILAATVIGVGIYAGSAMAEEVTTKSTTTTTDPAPGVTVGVPGVVGVQIGGGQGCTTQSKTKTNTDTGDSRTVTRSDC
jgi:hydroxymethylglutaryl-CoA reductase